MPRAVRIQRYEEAYRSDDGYEAWLVRGRREAAQATLRKRRPRRVVEVGCGMDPLIGHVLADPSAPPFDAWVVVEPVPAFAHAAADKAEGDARVLVRGEFFEDAAPGIAARHPEGADLVIVDSLLHERAVSTPLLESAHQLLRKEGFIHVSVPNARSLHRRVAHAMGILADPHERSGRKRVLEQARVYDVDGLERELREAGFMPVARGGHTIKPFTNAQMADVEKVVGARVLEGLYALGAELPALCAEVWVVARRA